MNQYFSEKIKVVSFFSIILVLYIHSGFHDYPHEIAGMQFNFLLQDIISGEIGRCAVPMFYMISGYLFFLNVESINDVYHKMRKRVHTLLIPYVVACLFFPLFCFQKLFLEPNSLSIVLLSQNNYNNRQQIFYVLFFIK